ncbi:MULTISPECIES: peptidylprolyl isomerase [unclassified Aminobacter]|jgi:peptidylprolyl isomerase|uniref:peptidylprolyl isomerase n=1 Tax=unclassified Aminobacter TaxID=2644704 RepID=UPI000465927E|nr:MULTISPECIES: peptidylprolyl isomerase [unclassified Aminobacter]TWG59382.1 peptidylprolyl isomerase [Aminobacter sp. J44]TWH33626.1 peptidylprolyl isomerase [Aminobacter sp. J15]
MQFLKFVSSALVAASLFAGSAALAADPENTMIIKLKDGEVVIALREDLAPKHVAQIKKLVRDGEYDNVAFHRVIEGFMAQTGDVQFGDLENGYNSQRVGMGGSSLPNIEAEFSNETFARGTVGMARSQDPNSANSQFFIMFAPGSFLDGSYTIVGNVESGMEFVDNIKRGQGPNGEVTDPDRMISVRIAADAK